MIDTHSHLTFSKLAEDLEGVMSRANAAGVTTFIIPATTVEDSVSGVELSKRYEDVYAGVGIHPTDAKDFTPKSLVTLKSLLEGDSRVVSIGEVGLDNYHFDGLTDEEVALDKLVQKEVFGTMISLAKEYSLPLIIHSRAAFDDTFEMLKDKAANQNVVIHCFTGTQDEAEKWLSIGCFLSFTAIITYKKNHNLRDIVAAVPLDRMMLETDSPFLPPEGRRGEVCEPAYVKQIAECVAHAKGTSFEEVDSVTTATAKSFFNLT